MKNNINFKQLRKQTKVVTLAWNKESADVIKEYIDKYMDNYLTRDEKLDWELNYHRDEDDYEDCHELCYSIIYEVARRQILCKVLKYFSQQELEMYLRILENSNNRSDFSESFFKAKGIDYIFSKQDRDFFEETVTYSDFEEICEDAPYECDYMVLVANNRLLIEEDDLLSDSVKDAVNKGIMEVHLLDTCDPAKEPTIYRGGQYIPHTQEEA